MGLREDPRALPESDSMPADREIRAIQLGGRGSMADYPRATENPFGKAGSSNPPETGISGPIKADGMMEEKNISGEICFNVRHHNPYPSAATEAPSSGSTDRAPEV